ncbi:hypothetical protein CO661_33045 [Sinorhizobium fredii]|uniref:Aspartate/glutamate racemase family protein n=1 Tax=Rhizobium fredii TaxID=380 RepID=A0A2A6LN49_RHIFR|nr:hypothetical protein [Sinorhizobium fredii]PDT43798.1 hypothetical protein CO661_33045 [Sinorhizobium fredii]
MEHVQKSPLPILGILDLEPGACPGKPPTPGTIQDPATFGFPVIRETAAGAWVDVVVPGDPELEPAFIAAAERLVQRGATAITADCGFSIRHQAAVAAAVGVPVALSALMLVPVILRQLPAGKLAIMTFDATCFGKDLLKIDDPIELGRIVISGVENTQTWVNEMARPPVPTSAEILQADVCSRIHQLREIHPDIGAVLLECTMFPRVAQSVRHFTGLPVYDITTLCRMLMDSTGARATEGIAFPT